MAGGERRCRRKAGDYLSDITWLLAMLGAGDMGMMLTDDADAYRRHPRPATSNDRLPAF